MLTDQLDVIFNILIYAGKKKYTGPQNILEIFENPDLAKNLMFRDIHLINLQSSSDEKISKDENKTLRVR